MVTCFPLVYSLVNFLCSFHDKTITNNQAALDLKLSIDGILEECGGIQLFDEILKKCAPSSSHSQSRPKWKPVPTDSWLLQVQPNQPWRSYKTQLYSRTRYNLAVYPDGTVNGTRDDSDLHTHLELLSGGGTGLVKIKGLLANMFVGMNRRGKLYAEPDPTSTNIVFIEEFQGDYTTYKSKKFEHRNWYIGIKKNGRFKRGPRTKIGQKAISFLPRNRKR